MLLSKKKSLVLSEYYYERSTALSLCVCVSVCVSFRRGGASVDDFDTMKAFSSFKGAEKNGLFRVSFSTLFLSCVTLNKVLSFFGKDVRFASLLFSSLCTARWWWCRCRRRRPVFDGRKRRRHNIPKKKMNFGGMPRGKKVGLTSLLTTTRFLVRVILSRHLLFFLSLTGLRPDDDDDDDDDDID